VPNGGVFSSPFTVTVRPPDANAALRYTLNASLPSGRSPLYTGPLTLTNTATLAVVAFEDGFDQSVPARAQFSLNLNSLPYFYDGGYFNQGVFQLPLAATPGHTYVLENTTNFIHWAPLSTNQAPAPTFELFDPNAAHSPLRFYRVREHR